MRKQIVFWRFGSGFTHGQRHCWKFQILFSVITCGSVPFSIVPPSRHTTDHFDISQMLFWPVAACGLTLLDWTSYLRLLLGHHICLVLGRSSSALPVRFPALCHCVCWPQQRLIPQHHDREDDCHVISWSCRWRWLEHVFSASLIMNELLESHTVSVNAVASGRDPASNFPSSLFPGSFLLWMQTNDVCSSQVEHAHSDAWWIHRLMEGSRGLMPA